MTTPKMKSFSDLWDAARFRLATSGSSLTLQRVHRATGVPVATLSDWRSGSHAPRDADRFLEVVRLLSSWAGLPPPNVREWAQLVDTSGAKRVSARSATLAGPPSWTPSVVGLADRLAIEFSAEHVEVDAICLTGQSLSLSVARPIQDVYAGKMRPRRIEFRVLMPSRDIDLAFPTSINGDHDRLQTRWLSLRNANAHTLRSALLSLRASRGIEVAVSFRAVPFTPFAELYLINGVETLFAFCTITRRTTDYLGEPVEVYEGATEAGLQRRFSSDDPDDENRTFVEQAHLWFNSVWETISAELFFSA